MEQATIMPFKLQFSNSHMGVSIDLIKKKDLIELKWSRPIEIPMTFN